MYGSQCWPLRKTEKDGLHIFKREVLKKKINMTLVLIRLLKSEEKHIPNPEPDDFFRRANIANEIKRSKLEWAWHFFVGSKTP